MNRNTHIIVSAMGAILAIAGLDHGIFEILQGNKPTAGLIIQAIGPEMNLWGTEEAFTLVPNFLVTGILAVLVSLALLVWSVRFVHTRHGAAILGLLFILLFLVGGGIAAQFTFAPIAWLAARQINRPLKGWINALPAGLSRIWPYTLALGSLSFLIGLFIAITGFIPGVTEDEQILSICWSYIFGGGLGMYLLSIFCGFAADVQTWRSAQPAAQALRP